MSASQPSASPSQWKIWLATTRPKTLFAALAPVLMGASMAWERARGLNYPIFLLTLATATAIQIGTNFCNDVFDHRQGADTEARQGPRRGLQSGIISFRAMVTATAGTFLLAAGLSVLLFLHGGMPIFWIATASILSGVFYTAGRRSLAYTGMADLFVIVFFGPVATAGTYYLQFPYAWPPWEVLVVGLGPGLIATALLTVNNLRDIDEDRSNRKQTLAVRFGAAFARAEYRVCLTLALLLPPWMAVMTGRSWTVLLLWVMFPQALKLMRRVQTGTSGPELNPVLGATGKMLLKYALLFSITWPAAGA
ncbi:MAG: 1,4-dihydroxy-2-naphthoate octaprenyltransferase [Verrucomicrobia bacterium]|nr:1,4-dihydroxy-2-naphthoate octaprenyltransferase [Verrucomicrobiota bacterium]MCH8511333.1 1,4-dihydroxy-2-naphthoate octaprenyltransferase [Kiritimatiellia bacterium]